MRRSTSSAISPGGTSRVRNAIIRKYPGFCRWKSQ
ncbi:Uncharacterised protein [Mycobacteroides abscessus subsp. abscessus]|nr:Uncharacterised protein [Mycobacteroides abscessus subsp. abscessus]